MLKEELANIVTIKDNLQYAMKQVEDISRTSVENTTEISASTQEQASGVQIILGSMENVQTGMERLSGIINAKSNA